MCSFYLNWAKQWKKSVKLDFCLKWPFVWVNWFRRSKWGHGVLPRLSWSEAYHASMTVSCKGRVPDQAVTWVLLCGHVQTLTLCTMISSITNIITCMNRKLYICVYIYAYICICIYDRFENTLKDQEISTYKKEMSI